MSVPAEVMDRAAQFSRVISKTKRKTLVFFYYVNDDSRAAAYALANAIDADCVPISLRIGNTDNVFSFSTVNRYDVVFFVTPAVNGKRLPDTFSRFLVEMRTNIKCKAIHFLCVTRNKESIVFKEMADILKEGTKMQMPTEPTSALELTTKEVPSFVARALLCVNDLDDPQKVYKVLGFHAYHCTHVKDCEHQKTCKHRHHRHHKEVEVVLEKERKVKEKKEVKKSESGKVKVKAEVKLDKKVSKKDKEAEKEKEKPKAKEKEKEVKVESNEKVENEEEKKEEKKEAKDKKSSESKSESSSKTSGSGSGSGSGTSSESESGSETSGTTSSSD